jgi:outer membrane protein TolC
MKKHGAGRAADLVDLRQQLTAARADVERLKGDYSTMLNAYTNVWNFDTVIHKGEAAKED